MKKTFSELFKEIIPVIIGILIALFINNWNEQRKEEKYVSQILESIKLELAESKIDIDKNISKQKILIDSLKHYASDNEMSIIQTAYKADGVHAPQIRINSWRAISNTKIELIDYDKLSTLDDIEEGKELLKEKLDYLMKFVFSNLKDTSEDKKELMILLLRDIISTEYFIKEDIESFED